jgi:hypothetical protein
MAETPEPDRLAAYLDREIKVSQERLHRSIGQKVRWAHTDLRELAYSIRMSVDRYQPLPQSWRDGWTDPIGQRMLAHILETK